VIVIIRHDDGPNDSWEIVMPIVFVLGFFGEKVTCRKEVCAGILISITWMRLRHLETWISPLTYNSIQKQSYIFFVTVNL
jgi:hypothetical protein